MSIGSNGHVKEKTAFSEGYIFKLWEFRSRLDFQSARAVGANRKMLLQEINKVDRNIENFLGKKPSDTREIKNLIAEKKAFSRHRATPLQAPSPVVTS